MFTKKWLTAAETANILAFSEATLRRLRQGKVFKAGVHYRRKFAGNHKELEDGTKDKFKKIQGWRWWQ